MNLPLDEKEAQGLAANEHPFPFFHQVAGVYACTGTGTERFHVSDCRWEKPYLFG